MSEPREFWIRKTESTFIFWETVITDQKPDLKHDPDFEDAVHVIEYKAYEDLKASMKSWAVAKEIEIYSKGFGQYMELKAELDRLKQESMDFMAKHSPSNQLESAELPNKDGQQA